ncbi:MAG TPA: carbohydrate kinase, partial [Deltaproteobacteria bacterium]|nr:carbohydrate kinase [Deltaproteobacteria bacterium]
MTRSPTILSIDLGTGGPKVALVGNDGTIVASALRPVTTIPLGPDAAEQDPEEIWSAILSAIREVLAAAGRPAEDILGISCTSQYFSIVPIDDSGHPVGPMIPWMDGRGAPFAQALYISHPETPSRWIETTGMPPLPSGNDSLSHILFLQNECPEIYERAAKLVEPADYVTSRLTGVCASNGCTAFAMLLTDNRELDSIAYHDELIRLSGVDRQKLPELVPIGSSLGPIRKEIAEEIGLSADTQVFAGVNDTHAAGIGTASHLRGHGALNIGTTCQVLAFVDDMRTDIDHFILSMPSPVPGRYMVMSEIGLGGKPLEHFLTRVVFADDGLAKHSVDDPFERVEEALGTAEPGSGGLLYLPWLAGSQSPRANPAMRGGFLNMSLETTRAHMLRAVLEGVSFSLRWALPAVEAFTNETFPFLRFSGGGAMSARWAQILADTMDRPIHQLSEPRFVNNRGTALLAFHALGRASLDET